MLLLEESQYNSSTNKPQLTNLIVMEQFVKLYEQKLREVGVQTSNKIRFKSLFIFHQTTFNKKLKLTNEILYYNYYESHFRKFIQKQEYDNIDARLYYITALFLCLKQQKRIKELKPIVNSLWCTLFTPPYNTQKFNEVIKSFEKVILILQKVVLFNLGYHLNIFTGQYFLDRFFAEYPKNDSMELKEFAYISLETLMLLTNKCIVIHPRILGKASILRASKTTKKKIEKFQNLQWYNWKYHPDQEGQLQEDYIKMIELQKQLALITFEKNKIKFKMENKNKK